MDASRRDRTMLRSVLCTFFISGAASQSLGAFIPFLREAYGFRYELAGVLLSLQSVGSMTAILISGLLPLYLGRRKSILLLAMWMAVAYGIFFTGWGGVAALCFAFLCTGISRGGNGNFSNTAVSTLPDSRRAFNLIHGFFAGGALVSPLALAGLTRAAGGSGWRILAGTLGLLCVVQLWIYGRMPMAPDPARTGVRRADWSFLRQRSFWLCAPALFLYISTEYAVAGWLVTYLQDTGRLDAARSQLMNSLFWLMILLGRLLGAWVNGRLTRQKLLLLDGLGLTAAFLALLYGRSQGVLILGILGVGAFLATIYTTVFSLGSEAMPGNDLGCSLLTFSGSIGGVAAPALVGLVAERRGIAAGMTTVAATVLLLLGAIVLINLLIKKKTPA